MIICTSFCNGKTHDFHLFKKSRLPLRQTTQVIVDTGYLGIHKIHSHSELPKKKSKYHPLTDADKEFNQTLASVRVLNENVIGCIKRFRIISDRYRNRRKRFALRFNLIDLCCQQCRILLGRFSSSLTIIVSPHGSRCSEIQTSLNPDAVVKNFNIFSNRALSKPTVTIG